MVFVEFLAAPRQNRGFVTPAFPRPFHRPAHVFLGGYLHPFKDESRSPVGVEKTPRFRALAKNGGWERERDVLWKKRLVQRC